MRKVYNIIRAVIVVALVAAILIYAGAYVLLSLPAVQQRIKQRAELEAGKYLETNVTIGQLSIEPFSRVTLTDVQIQDQQERQLLTAGKLGAGISLWQLLKTGRVVITYAELIGVDIAVVQENDSTPINAQFIIDKFKPKPNQPPRPYDVRADNVIIRQGHITFDKLDKPRKPENLFDPAHIDVQNLRADLLLQRIKNDDFIVNIKRIAMAERSGLSIDRLSADLIVDSTHIDLSNLDIELPHSHVAIDNFALQYSSLKTLGQELPTLPLDVKLSDDTRITPADFKALLPQLAAIDQALNVQLDCRYQAGNLAINTLTLEGAGQPLVANLAGTISNLNHTSDVHIDIPHISINADVPRLLPIVEALATIKPNIKSTLAQCGNVTVDGALQGTPADLDLDVDLSTAMGEITIDGNLQNHSGTSFAGHLATPHFRVGELLGALTGRGDLLSEIAFDADVDVNSHVSADTPIAFAGHIDYAELQGIRYDNIVVDLTYNGSDIDGHINADDEEAALTIDATLQRNDHAIALALNSDIRRLMLPHVVTGNKWQGTIVTGHAVADLSGNDVDNLEGEVQLDDLAFTPPRGTGFHLDNVSIKASGDPTNRDLSLHSDFVNANLSGQYRFKDLATTLKAIAADALPQLVPPVEHDSIYADLKITIEPREELQSLLKLPVALLDQITVNAVIDGDKYNVNLAAPYLLQGSKIIEQTSLSAHGDIADDRDNTLSFSTIFPHKQGKIPISLNALVKDGIVKSALRWKMMRAQDYSGELNLQATLRRDENRQMDYTVNIEPSHVTFNDTVWNIDPSVVRIAGGTVAVDNLRGSNGKQYVHINGKVSRQPEDVLELDLKDISLDYVFETLNINNVDFGGQATGHFYASDLLNGAPQIYTPGLHVNNLTYNDALMGDADITSRWLTDEKAVALRADILQGNGLKSIVDGAIYVTRDSLALDFEAQRANLAFMKPFMAAFAGDIQGAASGKATLYGTFKDINLKGDVVADTLNFLLAFTNVRYACRNEKIHIEPGLIEFGDITIFDRNGNTARLDGWLKHDNFHEPVFNFGVTQARGLLCYDTNERFNNVWYGEVYGNGSAFVTGSPGIVDVKVNMETAPGSKFTFVLSDAATATEYKFITYRSKRYPQGLPVAAQPTDTLPEAVRKHLARAQTQNVVKPTAFNIDLQGDITPDVALRIVMDQTSGDQIKATGSGNMRLTYNSNDEMEIYGKYTLERGHYNFTLQDIIIKDFIIRDGSSITFRGDPYAAAIDLQAVYATNANLRDLDESFSTDVDLQRTNVPVHAVLIAKGLMSQPDIDFDLEFPTLNSDAVRKVHSIVSTEEMMNQQIIYLLAINRFYTPDYVDATRNNNEFTNVASSTISSQLSSMLGKMSENWTISPNFRSAKGDFSDVEVELALSSQLLNNRLLFNGNFGYRDNTYNTRNSNFIGDFDIEYLLNSRGTLRLKAYNRFNDQNYYLRNALTTQGVGIVWKHDFDNLRQLFKGRRKAKQEEAQPNPVEPADSTTTTTTTAP